MHPPELIAHDKVPSPLSRTRAGVEGVLSRPQEASMTRLIASEFVTLDGVMEAPGHEEHRDGKNAWALQLASEDMGDLSAAYAPGSRGPWTVVMGQRGSGPAASRTSASHSWAGSRQTLQARSAGPAMTLR